jgi:hypothetical protein
LTRSHYRENAFHVGKLNCTFRDAAQKASADYATSAARRAKLPRGQVFSIDVLDQMG